MTTETTTTVKKLLTTKEAAAYLSISLPTLFRLLRAGELPHVRLGRVIRFRPEDLDAFLASRVTTEWTDFNPERKPRKAAAVEIATPSRTTKSRKSPQTRTMGHKKEERP